MHSPFILLNVSLYLSPLPILYPSFLGLQLCLLSLLSPLSPSGTSVHMACSFRRWNFPMSRLSVSRPVGLLVFWCVCHNFLKEREVSLLCSFGCFYLGLNYGVWQNRPLIGETKQIMSCMSCMSCVSCVSCMSCISCMPCMLNRWCTGCSLNIVFSKISRYIPDSGLSRFSSVVYTDH